MDSLWRPAYVAIGSNLNDPRARVEEAFERLAGLATTRLVGRSRLYATRPMGPQDQPEFVNAAAGLLTWLSARLLLEGLLRIEQSMGRNRQERWGVSRRNFVLYPLADIAPTLAIPGHGNVADLMSRAGAEGISVLE
jgi:2-amino-4-hydroxy-6-hydroxymethyldihydropteridine diphosphokinase